MRILNTILAVLVALLVILFAVSNRLPVRVEIWPFPFQVEMGLYAVILLAVLIGFLAGMVAMWLAGAARRRDNRRMKREIKDLQASLARAQPKQEMKIS